MALLVVQRGHVPRTSGATGAPGEQAFATEAAERTRHHVNAVGHVVRIINADEPDHRYRGDAFVALHYDSSSSPSAHGASVGYQTPEGRALASAWKRHYQANGWTRGFRGDNYTSALGGYYGVRRAVSGGNRRAVILEAGFHSNPDDARLLASPAGPDRVGRAVAAALVDILGAKCPTAPQPADVPPYPGLVELGDGMPPAGPDERVRAWQREFNRRLGYYGTRHELDEDGRFGDGTYHVVTHFQSRHAELDVDGVAGPATWHALLFA